MTSWNKQDVIEICMYDRDSSFGAKEVTATAIKLNFIHKLNVETKEVNIAKDVKLLDCNGVPETILLC